MGGEHGLATVVGLSTEGYGIASTLVKNGVETIIVDENLYMGMKLTPEVVSSYVSVSSLLEEESLTGYEPMDASIARSKYVFFTPKIRRTDKEAKTEVNTRFRGTVKSISKDSIVVFCLPAGFGENRGNVSLIENVSGFRSGEDFEYVYAPLQPRSNTVQILGLEKTSRKVTEIFKRGGLKTPQPVSFDKAELIYFRHILSSYLSSALDLEVYRKVSDRSERLKMKKILGYKEIYVDKVTELLFDLRVISGTLDTGDPSIYLASGILKSVDGYVKYLVEEVRSVIKEMILKASKTKVTLAWSVDKYEMRGDRIAMLENIVNKTHDYIGDVNILSGTGYSKLSGRGSMGFMPDMGKVEIVVICSEQDYVSASKILKFEDKRSDVIALKADLLIDYVR